VTVDRPHREGWAALAEGRWADARTLFRQALSSGDRPDALEGLSWAAWWLDDAPTVFDARSRAYALFRHPGAVHAETSSTRPRRRATTSAGLPARSAPRRSGRAPTWQRGCSGPRTVVTISPGLCWRARSTGSMPGGPFEAAEARRELAVTLAALGRNDVAAGQPAEYVYEYLLVVAQKR